MQICNKYLITGKVQGVFYRASCESQAMKLGITGYAINLADGRVEVLACGEKENIDQFCRYLRIGSRAAKVVDVQCESVEEIPPAFFTVA